MVATFGTGDHIYNCEPETEPLVLKVIVNLSQHVLNSRIFQEGDRRRTAVDIIIKPHVLLSSPSLSLLPPFSTKVANSTAVLQIRKNKSTV